jgi:ribosomal protein L7/L12
MFFQRINVSLAALQRKIKRSHVVAKHNDQVYLVESPPVNCLVSSGNLWIDECLKGAYKYWYQVVNSNKAFMDGIECTYCNVAMLKEDNKNQRQLRLNWCEIHCENKSYYLATKQYNLEHFGVPFAPFSSESMKKHHEQSDVHKMNVEEYNKSSDGRKSVMCKVIALLECSTVMMHKIIIFVRFQEEKESTERSRFIDLHDEAFSFHVKLESSFNVLRKAALLWPYPKSFSLLLKEAKKLCEDAQRFFHQKVHQHEKEIMLTNYEGITTKKALH